MIPSKDLTFTIWKFAFSNTFTSVDFHCRGKKNTLTPVVFLFKSIFKNACPRNDKVTSSTVTEINLDALCVYSTYVKNMSTET